MKKFIKILVLFTLFFNSAKIFAADLQKIEVVDNWNITVWTTNDLVLEPWKEVKWDLKVLKDQIVSFAAKDPQNPKKIILNLVYELEKNKKYTILWIDWAEANMNFSTWDELKWEYKNEEESLASLKIEKINIFDPKTVEIFYNEDIKKDDFIFRFLTDLEVKNKVALTEDIININLKEPLEDLTSYMIISSFLEDKDWKEVKLKDIIYEFETKKDLKKFYELPEKEILKEEVAVKDEWNIEEIAMKLEKTPESWAKTNILILLTIFVLVFILSVSFFKKS